VRVCSEAEKCHAKGEGQFGMSQQSSTDALPATFSLGMHHRAIP
jgi:hypothetical protein